ncbi:MAG: hypothetical protein M3N26_05990, partial [Pseudomonadota bacterium]|nr:hypothetical protein [Pseudomonadota bacterium]
MSALESAAERPLGAVLDTLAGELGDLAVFAAQLQVELSPCLSAATDAATAQSLDMLTQVIADLACFVTDVATIVPPELCVGLE